MRGKKNTKKEKKKQRRLVLLGEMNSVHAVIKDESEKSEFNARWWVY